MTKQTKMKRIKQNKELIYLLSKSPRNFQRAILKHSDDEIIHVLVEIVLNALRGNCCIEGDTKCQLKKYKTTMRKLICPFTPIQDKRKLLIQSGGFLSILLPTLISGVLSHIFQH